MTETQASLIEATLREHSLCREVIRFLVANENAMDTVKGIAAYWVRSDEVAVQSAMDLLVICGAVICHTLSSGAFYRFTPNRAIRAGLRKSLGMQRGREQVTPLGDQV
jgi:hypothetical protein